MDGSAINLPDILEKAKSWTFAGDCTLLEWMQQISKDLENRATKTTSSLSALDYNVRSTSIALDNVANSLTTLQFGNQFVECRVKDDDETLNANNSNSDNKESAKETCTSEEMLYKFLDNNLKVLRNCHEKYSIDLEDSDDEETSKEKTCIYQPINPYNDRALPFIFGSKDWHSKWHVGLYESQQENSCSGDEISEAFSESSSISRLDDESFESNTEWASSNSIDNDNLNSNIEIKNASSLRGSEQLYPVRQIPISSVKTKTTVNQTSPTSTTSSLAKTSVQAEKQKEGFTEGSGSTNSINSKYSFKTKEEVSADHKQTPVGHKSHSQKDFDLFVEPAEDVESITSSSPSLEKDRNRISNDNLSKEKVQKVRTVPAPFVDLFAEPPEDVISFTKPSQHIKRTVVNLFDDDDEDDDDEMYMAKNDLLSVVPKTKYLEKCESRDSKTFPHAKFGVTNEPPTVSQTPKSLFDDSDEDEDFLKAFIGKPLPKSETSNVLFANAIPNASENRSQQKTVVVADDAINFNDIMQDDSNVFLRNRKLNEITQSVKPSSSDKNILQKPDSAQVATNPMNLFDDFNDVPKGTSLNADKISKKINLFGDFDDEDGKDCGCDLFSSNSNSVHADAEGPLTEYEDKFVENTKDTTALKTNEPEELSIDVLTQDSTKSDEEDNNKSRELLSADHTIEQTTVSEITYSNKDTGPFRSHGILPAEDAALEESPNHKNYRQGDIIAPLTSDKSVSFSENVPKEPGSSIKYDMNSILFFDEPPEDDKEFSEKLEKTASTLNSNYNAIDLENDSYEPALPQVPVTNTNHSQVDASEKFYTGLQLFSDVPPDDDAAGCNTLNNSPDANQTKRLHCIFYDDFNETLMALNQKPAGKRILGQSIISEEPPPMIEEQNAASKHTVDHKVPVDKEEITYAHQKLQSSGLGSKPRKSLYKNSDENTNETSNKRPVLKLQMPDININVQALLPGANNNLRRAKEDNATSKRVNSYYEYAKPLQNIPTATVGANVTSEVNRIEVTTTPGTEYILPNITKNRVKASAARRPSTRRARQENYRRSLVEQQQILENCTENSETRNEVTKNINTSIGTQSNSNIPQLSPTRVKCNLSTEVQKAGTSHEIIQSKTSVLFDDKRPDSHDTINACKTNVLETTKNIPDITAELPKYSVGSSLIPNDKAPAHSLQLLQQVHDDSSLFLNKTETKSEAHGKIDLNLKSNPHKVSLLFEDEEDDDNFFKHINSIKIVSKSKENEHIQTAKSAAGTGELNVSTPPIPTASDANTKVTKERRQSVLLQAEHSEAVAQNTMQHYVKTKASEDNEQKSPANAMFEIKSTLNKPSVLLNEEDDDYDLFKASAQQPRTSTGCEKRNYKTKSQLKSFLNSNSSSEEEPTAAASQATTPTHSSTTPSGITPNLSNTTPRTINAKLFTSSESDSDDLFGKLASTISSNTKISSETSLRGQSKSQPKAFLFGGDSDSDDFLTASTTAGKPRKSEGDLKKNNPRKTTEASVSLFSDVDSDEDDLFGLGAPKVKTRNVRTAPHVKAASATKPATASEADSSKLKTVDDNPLADLL